MYTMRRSETISARASLFVKSSLPPSIKMSPGSMRSANWLITMSTTGPAVTRNMTLRGLESDAMNSSAEKQPTMFPAASPSSASARLRQVSTLDSVRL